MMCVSSVDFFYRIEQEEEDVSGVKFGASNECELSKEVRNNIHTYITGGK
jgi:hypothetical protein